MRCNFVAFSGFLRFSDIFNFLPVSLKVYFRLSFLQLGFCNESASPTCLWSGRTTTGRRGPLSEEPTDPYFLFTFATFAAFALSKRINKSENPFASYLLKAIELELRRRRWRRRWCLLSSASLGNARFHSGDSFSLSDFKNSRCVRWISCLFLFSLESILFH